MKAAPLSLAVSAFLVASAAPAPAQSLPARHALAGVRASIDLPAGWDVSLESDDGVFVYHFAKRERPGGPELASLTLSVTTKVPDRAGQKPSAYAAELLDVPQDDGSPAKITGGRAGALPSLRSEYDFEGDSGKTRAVNIAIPNDATGTLYFITWQSPPDEPLEFEALREKMAASLAVDPSF